MRFQNLVCAAIVAFCSVSTATAADPRSNTHNPFESTDQTSESKAPVSGKKKIATSVPGAKKSDKGTDAEGQKPGETTTVKAKAPAKKLTPAQQKELARKKRIEKAKQKALAEAPFKNNHYVLTGVMPVNGFHKGKPIVVIVDKGSHFTHVLQLQGKRICRVLTISNAVGTADRPTPPGPYLVVAKKKLPTWVPPRSIDPKQKPVPPYNLTHRNPLGVASIYLNKFEINLHGTNQQNLIRKSVSHGCVRHSNKDIMKLYAMVKPGDRVYIVNKFRGKVINRSDFTNPR